MPLARTHAAILVGLRGRIVEIEADLSPGLPGVAIVGLPDTALSEARDRVRAAVLNSGQAWPAKRITVNLSPADLPKRGSSLDLGVALAVLAAAGVVPPDAVASRVFLGELGLDGRVREVRGVLPAAMACAAGGWQRVVVPVPNAAEARLVPDLVVEPAATLSGLLARLRGGPAEGRRAAEPPPDPVVVPDEPPEVTAPPTRLDLADVVGQLAGRAALEMAAVGGHHLSMSGPPGAGKTMLAQRLPGLLPPLRPAEALEVSAVHSVAGVLRPGRPLVSTPPFCAPHHTASVAALVGGGSGVPRPGAVSIAHRGVLFLDEAAEFAGGVLDALRQPLETGEVTIARASGVVRYPARFQLVMASNPCPCAAVQQKTSCRCSATARRRYAARLSGPLLDRVDLIINLDPVTRADLFDHGPGESTAVVAARVAQARERSAHRLADTSWTCNAEVPGSVLRGAWRLAYRDVEPLSRALDHGTLTARGVDRVLRMAWTQADLGGRDRPSRSDVQAALLCRVGAGYAA